LKKDRQYIPQQAPFFAPFIRFRLWFYHKLSLVQKRHPGWQWMTYCILWKIIIFMDWVHGSDKKGLVSGFCYCQVIRHLIINYLIINYSIVSPGPA